MYFNNLAGPIALIVMTVIMFLLVPGNGSRFFPVGFVFGVVLGAAT